jgi:hypothetical protein
MITEAQVAVYLHRRLHNLATLVGQAVHDSSPQGYGDDISDALRRMGFANAAAITLASDEAALGHVSEFYALYRFASLLATRVDIDAYAVDDDRGRVFDNVITLMEQAGSKAALYGYIMQVAAPSPGSGSGSGASGGTAVGIGSVGRVVGAWSDGEVKTGWTEPGRVPLQRWP